MAVKGSGPGLSDHYAGMALDIATRELPMWMRRRPRVVLWGGREGDVQFGSDEDQAWERAHRPRTPTFLWSQEEFHHHSHLHVYGDFYDAMGRGVCTCDRSGAKICPAHGVRRA